MDDRPGFALEAGAENGEALFQFGLSTDQRALGIMSISPQTDKAPHIDIARKALYRVMTFGLGSQHWSDRANDLAIDNGLPAAGKCCKPRGEVHRFAGDGIFAELVATGGAGDHLAGGDTDVRGHRAADACRDLGHNVMNTQRRPHGAGQVVGMGKRSTKDRHDTIADVFVDGSAMLDDDVINLCKEGGQQFQRLLGPQFATQCGVARNVREKHAHLPPFGLFAGGRRDHVADP